MSIIGVRNRPSHRSLHRGTWHFDPIELDGCGGRKQKMGLAASHRRQYCHACRETSKVSTARRGLLIEQFTPLSAGIVR